MTIEDALSSLVKAVKNITTHPDVDIQDLHNFGLWEPLISALKDCEEKT